MFHRSQRFIRNESGATAIEYGLLAALIGVAIIAGASSLGTTINAKLGAVGVAIGNGLTSTAQ